MTSRKLMLIALLVTFFALASGDALNSSQRYTLSIWLAGHPSYRLATDEDCQCPSDIELVRKGQGGVWKPRPNYHPYMAIGDFNGDGIEDFAVVVVDRRAAIKNFTLLVFNGGRTRTAAQPALKLSGLDFRHKGLFFGPPRPKPYRLVVGPYEAEGQVLIPVDGHYKLRDVEE
jgi:hypothetical protein